VRAFDLLWNERAYQGGMEVEVQSSIGWTITLEFLADSTEQIYVRPKPTAEPAALRRADLRSSYVPPMTGLSVAEPVYQRPKLDQLLGQARPGEIIRNLLVEAHQSDAWPRLTESIHRLFGYELLPPNASGPDIVAEYKARPDGPSFDIASAGSGFQQILLLLTFLHTRPGSTLLLDEPDAHLHVFLQDAIYGELRSVAAKADSQLIIATHSEVIINSVGPQELCMLLHRPRLLSDIAERTRLGSSLGILTQTDVMMALEAPGILYLEGRTDLDNLREWSRILGHPVYEVLSQRPFWKPTVWEPRAGAPGIKAREHYDAVKLVRDDLPGLILLDSDGKQRTPGTEITGAGLQRIKWRRYETESYLIHPAALERFVELKAGPGDYSKQAKADVRTYFESLFTSALVPDFYANPLRPNPLIENFLEQKKARQEILPGILNAAGIHGFEYTRFHEIAAVMQPEEIHPEVKEKLDAIQKAFRL
jgi:hypothetical protein